MSGRLILCHLYVLTLCLLGYRKGIMPGKSCSKNVQKFFLISGPSKSGKIGQLVEIIGTV